MPGENLVRLARGIAVDLIFAGDGLDLLDASAGFVVEGEPGAVGEPPFRHDEILAAPWTRRVVVPGPGAYVLRAHWTLAVEGLPWALQAQLRLTPEGDFRFEVPPQGLAAPVRVLVTAAAVEASRSALPSLAQPRRGG
jgi:hypothetical protein